MAKKKQKLKKAKRVAAPKKVVNYSSILGLSNKIWCIILFAFSALLYANTLGHDFTQDDAIVIYENMHTENGISGIPGILTKDSFHGYFKDEGKAKLVAGGRYRPMSMITFAIGYQIFGENPFVGHLMNVLWYGLLCVLILLTLQKLEFGSKEQWGIIALITAFIYAAHPVHTEVVANIKGRDEIYSMLGSIAALFLILKSIETKKKSLQIWAAVVFFSALMSKENAITFLAVVPLVLYFFKKQSLSSALMKTMPLLGASALFIIIRSSILGMDFGGTPMELMNNPFLTWTESKYEVMGFGQKLATIIFILGKYLQLLFFPHPLTHDYYPKQIDVAGFADPAVWASLAMYVALFGLLILSWKKNKLISFIIAYFIITISIVSNIVFPIGTNLSERFLFMPSLSVALLVGYGLSRFVHKKTIMYNLIGIILLLLSLKTVKRNMVWKNDYTLFTTDVLTSKNSAKMNNAAAGAISNFYYSAADGPKRNQEIEKANGYAQKALEIHPQYKNASLISGNCYHYLGDYVNAEKMYQKTLGLDPNFADAIKNMAINDRELGKYYGEEKGDLTKALSYLNRAYKQMPKDYETVRLLGVANGIKGDHQNAIKFFTQATQLQPNLADAFRNLATAYQTANQGEEAIKYFQKATELDANAPK